MEIEPFGLLFYTVLKLLVQTSVALFDILKILLFVFSNVALVLLINRIRTHEILKYYDMFIFCEIKLSHGSSIPDRHSDTKVTINICAYCHLDCTQ